MIKNSKQLTLTKKRVDEFNITIEQLSSESDLHPMLAKAQLDALAYQRDELINQINEYEQLLSEDYVVFDVDSISELPKALIRARISLGYTQKDLAERLGLKEQQIQRYENTEYSAASFSKLVSIVEALDLKIREDVFLPKESRTKNLLLEKLRDAGLDRAFIEKRIAPRNILAIDSASWVEKTVTRITSVFGWFEDILLGDNPLVIGRDASMVARFKMPEGANQVYASAYTQYAFYLSNIIVKNYNAEMKDISSNAEETRNRILEQFEEINFKSILAYVSQLGIPVIALNDSGAFHGATWRIEGRNVIVLKQKSLHVSKWAFDLLHELYHASQHSDKKEFSLIELSETSEERREDKEELEANNFASKVLLGKDVDEYIELCFKKSQGKISWLKNSVIQVAKKKNLDCGVLAYQVANILEQHSTKSGTKNNWWGAAHNLQENYYNPKLLCIDTLKENLAFEALDNVERELIEQAFLT